MEKYIILAWLPSSDYFVASDANGEIGSLTSDGFEKMGEWFLASAVAKHNYKLVKDRPQIAQNEVTLYAKHLAETL